MSAWIKYKNWRLWIKPRRRKKTQLQWRKIEWDTIKIVIFACQSSSNFYDMYNLRKFLWIQSHFWTSQQPNIKFPIFSYSRILEVLFFDVFHSIERNFMKISGIEVFRISIFKEIEFFHVRFPNINRIKWDSVRVTRCIFVIDVEIFFSGRGQINHIPSTINSMV